MNSPAFSLKTFSCNQLRGTHGAAAFDMDQVSQKSSYFDYTYITNRESSLCQISHVLFLTYLLNVDFHIEDTLTCKVVTIIQNFDKMNS